MIKDPKTPLKELLGANYSDEAQQLFDQRGYLSMAMFAKMLSIRAVKQDAGFVEGAAFFRREFPKLDWIQRATIVPR